MSDSTCSIEGCGSVGKITRGWCQKHYKRWYKTGDPLGIRPRKGPAEERFWARVGKDGPTPSHRPELGPCWPWTGARNERDYGNFAPSMDVWVGAHRYSWELANERQVPDGLFVLHHCDNPPCVRPDHLFVGTHQANVTDMIGKRRHMHGERHWRATLTDEQVAAIRSRLTGRRGEIVALAREFNTTRAMVQHIKLGDRRAEATHFIE